jgi:hypothetical protein
MSAENVETVRLYNEAWNQRDLKTWLAWLHPDAEIDWSRSRGPLKGVYSGHGEHEVFWSEFWSTFEDVQVEMHSFTEVGSEVVVPNTAHLRGREVIEVVARSAFVCSQSRTGRSLAFGCSRSEPRPSKPPGCGSSSEVALWTSSGGFVLSSGGELRSHLAAANHTA